MSQDVRDWYIMIHISGFAISVMAYVYRHPGAPEFASACAAVGTLVGLYHWFTLQDSKEPDANVSADH